MKELIESIEDYIKKPYTDYAIMINGEWGSGKTHFWNHKLRGRIEAIRNSKGKLYKTIYISLYGINSIEEISKKIFLETNPLVSKTLKKFVDNAEGNIIPEYVKTGVDIANLYGAMNTSANQMDFAKLFSTDDKVLCFDDLERANIDIIDILGYINNFVEHDGIKTILICNEKELAIKFKNNNIEMKTLIATMLLKEEGVFEKNIEDTEPLVTKIDNKIKNVFDRTNAYERIKEKLIGECFEYMPEYSYILNGMIMKYGYNKELEKFLKMEISTIISTFKKTNTRNLRVLKHALNDFEKIFTSIKESYKEVSSEALRTILMFTIAISFEIKIGSEVKQIFDSISSNEEYKAIIYTSNIINDQKGYYLREFDTRYFLNSKEDYRFFKFIELYVRNRVFDTKVFNENMKELLADKKSEKSLEPEYTKLLNGSYWKLPDFDFTILVEQVLYEVKEGKIPSKDYIKLFAVYKHLSEIGLVKAEFDDVHTKFMIGYKQALLEETKFNIKLENIDTESIKDTVIKEFAKECNRLKIAVCDEILRERVKGLFNNLIDNIDEFYKQILTEYALVPIFEKYDMDVLYTKLENIPNNDLYNFISIISTRYEENKELLSADSSNLKRLAAIIEEKQDGENMTIKKALLSNLRTAIIKLT